MSKAPPMNGKEGMSPNIGNSVAKPLPPMEHAVVSIRPLGLSYTGSRKRGRMSMLRCGVLGEAEGAVVRVDSVRLAVEGEGQQKQGGTDEDSGGVKVTEDGIGVGDALDGEAWGHAWATRVSISARANLKVAENILLTIVK